MSDKLKTEQALTTEENCENFSMMQLTKDTAAEMATTALLTAAISVLTTFCDTRVDGKKRKIKNV